MPTYEIRTRSSTKQRSYRLVRLLVAFAAMGGKVLS